MIKIENVETYGWEAAIRGMRNPMNSWDKSDSGYCNVNCEDGEKCPWDIDDTADCCFYFHIGDEDLKLMKNLARAGNDHGKFMRMIGVSLDIVAPLYWWKEFDTYKVGTVANSCSTMHKIAAKPFEIADFSHEHLDGASRDMFVQNSKEQPYFFCSFEDMLYIQIEALNKARGLYLETKNKKYWWQMIQLLPSSYNQRRTVMFNYAVLMNIYASRKNHKLDEWRDFCNWIEGLPYSELIIGVKEND